MRHLDNSYIDSIPTNNIKNIGEQPRKLSGEKSRVTARFHFDEQDYYDDVKGRPKYSRSERKDMIRIAKKIYVRPKFH